jgi:glycosyltransferase involved in cell wall biosynthesis
MKILSIHNFYFISGGSDRCFFDLNQLLESKGHEVIPFSTKDPRNLPCAYSEYFIPQMDFDVSKTNLTQTKSLVNMLYSIPAKRNLEKLLNYIQPAVAHLHNIYGRISPSILPVLKKNKVPIVQTLHDFKLICPNHRMFANGSICEECKGGRFYQAVLKRCSYSSATFGLVLALESYLHHWLNIYQKHVDAFISPSNFLKNKLIEFGVDSEKIFVLPNFVRIKDPDASFNSSEPSVDGIYFGSLIPEKGVEVFIRSVVGLKNGVFRIVGGGYLRNILGKMVNDEITKGGPSIEFVGHLGGERLRKEISNSLMVIVPSILYENAPMAVLEAFSQGKPVLGSRLGGISELIKDGENGYLFQPGNPDDLLEKMSFLLKDRSKAFEMGQKARMWVKKERAPEGYYERLLSIYQKVGVKNL